MKAIVYTTYGPPDVLQLQEVAKPMPKENEVLIKIYATSVTTGDCNARDSVFVPAGLGPIQRVVFGLRKPKKTILGMELAGEVEAVGKDVTSFKVGDQVFGTADADMGAYAEYICRPEQSVLAPKPANLTYEEAASIPFGALTALIFLRDMGKIQRGQKILIYGASGCVGAYAVQLAKHYGAEVTGVCSSTNLALVKSLGADQVIDYTKEDFTKNGESYDSIFDTVGKTSFAACKKSLKPQGRYLAGAGGLRELFQMLGTAMASGKKVVGGPAFGKKADLLFLKELLEVGQLKPVVDRCYALEEIVEAHRYVDKGRKKGSVVITIAQNSQTETAAVMKT